MTTVKDITDASQKKQALVEISYGKINDLLGGGAAGQLFSMEFPSRPLNHQLYEYDTLSLPNPPQWTTDSNDSITRALTESSASSGGGFLCFSR